MKKTFSFRPLFNKLARTLKPSMKPRLQQIFQFIDRFFTNQFPLFLAMLVSILLLCTIGVNYLGFFEPLEARLIDLRFQTRPRLKTELPVLFSKRQELKRDVVMVQVTDDCLAQLGKWPWSRKNFAHLIDTLGRSGASVIAFDISFYDRDENDLEGDQELVTSLKKANRVVLASELVRTMRLQSREGVLELPSPGESQLGAMVIEEKKPNPEFLTQGVSTGFVNIHVADGVVRQFPLLKKVGAKSYRSLALKSFEELTGEGVLQILSESRLKLGDYDVPTWSRSNRAELISKFFQHSIDDSLFEHFVYLNYLGPSSEGNFYSVAISDVIGKKIDLRIFQNKIVLIGFNAHSLDKKLTPFGIMPGVEVQATVLSNLLNHNFLTRGSNLSLAIFLFLLSILLLYLNSRFDLKTSFALNLVLSLLLYLLGSILFSRNNYILDLSPVFFQTWGQFVLCKLAILSRSLRQRMLHLEQLNAHSRELFTILDPDRLTQAIFDMIQSHTACERGIILTIDQVSEQIEYHNFGTHSDEFMVAISRKEFREVLFKHWEGGRGLIQLKELESKLSHHYPGGATSDVLLFPLYLKDRPYGIIFVFKKSFDDIKEGLDSDFWSTLCQIIVAALENARLYKLATVDGLTGLFVRQFFDVQIQKEFFRATRYGERVGYLMSDIDHFKGFNDTYGHEMGDRVLRIVADEIKKSIRSVDIAARYGGEELCVILPNTDREGSIHIAERIRENIENLRIPHEGDEITITCSVGVSSIPENNPVDVKEFLKQADFALYEAKNAGRNQVKYYERKK